MTVTEWLGENNKLGKDIWEKKYRFKNESFDEWLDRVSSKNKELRQLIKERKFLFGGRALSNRGTSNNGSYFNCYSRGFIKDDLNDIMQANTDIALTYKAQGGQGISLSKLRPIGTPIGESYKSDGIIPFMKMYNETTSTISQGGSRKGALMISLDCRHKEAENFITIKSNDTEISKANLSLEIDDTFMECVKKYYETGEETVLHEVKNYDGHVIEYDITPIKIYKLLCQSCYDWADPAILYVDEFRNYNLMEFVDEYQIETCNPCGEQPLPKNFCCNLGSLNLAEFIKKPFTKNAIFDYDSFKEAIFIAVKALDTIIDENKDNHALKIQSENSINYRNIGLGIFAYANALMMLGMKYGSPEAKEFTDLVFNTLFRNAVKSSTTLAKEKGKFPKYSDNIWDSRIIRAHFSEEEIDEFKKYGIRNCSLISIAPTGSIATMLGRSGGCEPEFAISYKRKTESLNGGAEKYYDVFCLTAQEYQNINKTKTLPDYFVSSANIDYRDRIDIQSIMQKHVDTAISSTVNLPNKTTIAEVENLYLYAWEKKLKGITIFRDGCKRLGILTTDNKATTSNSTSDITYNSIQPISRKSIGTTHGSTYCKKCACGTLYITINKDDNGNIVECFVHTSKGGICQANIGAVNRMASLAMRSGVKIDEIADQLKGINCPACVKVKTKGEKIDGLSCPDIIAKTLLDFARDKKKTINVKPVAKIEEAKTEPATNTLSNADKCPECGAEIRHDGGCVLCLECGWSKCS